MQKGLISKLCIVFITVLISFFGIETAQGQTLPEQEIDSLNSILKADRSLVSDSAKCRAYNALAFNFLFNEMERAKPLLEHGLQLARQSGCAPCEAELLNTKATYFDLRGNLDSALVNFRQALGISEREKLPNFQVLSINGLGLLHWKNGNYEDALSRFYQALSITEKHLPHNTESLANYLSNIGLIHQELHQYPKAIAFHKKALKIRSEYKLINGMAISNANLGVCYKNTADYGLSETYFLEAIRLAEEAQNWRMYYALHDDLGNVYNLSNQDERAIKHYLEALDKPAEIGPNPRNDLNTYSNLASIYNKQNNPKQALIYGQKAEALLAKHPQLFLQAAGLFYALAETHYMQGQIAQGKAYMERYRMVTDSLFSEQNSSALAKLEADYELEKKDNAILKHQQELQTKNIELQNRNIWLIVFVGLGLFGVLAAYFIYKRKEAKVEQAHLKLKLAEEQERGRLQAERLRISRELHDNIGSYLTLLQASVDRLPDMDTKDSKESQNLLQQTLSLSMRELRKTVWLLNNPKISIESLAIRLRDFFKPWSTDSLAIKLVTKGNLQQFLSDIQTTHLVRIIQEAVNNAVKHAEAREIVILLDAEEEILFRFHIQDNGMGFQPEGATEGNGIRNMQERIRELKGTIHVASKVQSGCTIEGEFPIEPYA
ncbi:MAG: tetratricopeptide repeat protein [Bacteroidetes bacterium]|nr:MAG: tetratricopeptide repeat protein [Bacteroidota bacterium]